MKKQMFKCTLISSAILIEFLVGRGHIAFAAENSPLYYEDPMYDYDGNKIKSTNMCGEGDEYYLEPANEENESQGIVIGDWSNSQWAKLGSKSDAMTVKIHNNTCVSSSDLDIKEGIPDSNTPLEIQFETNVEYPNPFLDPFNLDGEIGVPAFLIARSNGIELDPNAYRKKASNWSVYQKVQGGKYVYAFENLEIGKFLSYKKVWDWLSVDQSEIDKNTLWKLVKK
ncbi:hypothetical protein CUC43_31590 (plasmid) [Bacillus thuringiensis LM1212]|uniref:hypothetical protein n=1 Tax=Bacillus cereus group TaxID=86661 RepID=UPI0004972647|nr:MULTISPECIES: hypothetical protein [Bacillus cereus group]AXY11205.1 hypothetical protein CUC43_31590 [Bacillus thuringiensis LM1212]QDF27412.1 hypothetical protein FJR70_32185 [Bacillus tropicus]QUG99092.1 hypothetical protein HCM98_29945 [Bacillus tropicus]